MSFPKITFGTLTQLQFGNDDIVTFNYTHTFTGLIEGREYQLICRGTGPATEWPYIDPEEEGYIPEPSPVLEVLKGSAEDLFTELTQVSIYFSQPFLFTFVAKEPKLKVNYTLQGKGLGDGSTANIFQTILLEDYQPGKITS